MEKHTPATAGVGVRARKRRMEWVVEDINEGNATPDEEQKGTSRPAELEMKGSKSITFTTDEVFQLISTISRQGEQTPQRLNNNYTNNVIPEFNPSNKNQNIDSWIAKVNECATIYEWVEKQTIHFALQKLNGLAKVWLEALPSVIYSWDEWQSKLRKAFPNEQNYGKLLEEMLARTTRYNETLSEYFYDKLTLLNRCEISGKKAVHCIVHGINDKSIRNGAQALNCNEPEDLLNFLNSQRPSYGFPFQKRRFEFNAPKRNYNTAPVNNMTSNSSNNLNTGSCFNCRMKGHSFLKCPKPITKCHKCQRVGHDSNLCNLTPLNPRSVPQSSSNGERKVLTIATQNDTNDKFFKKASINGHNFVAYIDFGSDSSLIRETEARCLSSEKCYHNLPVIKGFGNSCIVTLYKIKVNLQVDEVDTVVELLVVNDDFLQTPLLIGQNFTESPHVTVLKDHKRLFFYKIPKDNCFDLNSSFKLNLDGHVQITKIGLVNVYASDSNFSGDIYVEGYTSGEPEKEFHLHQGAYRLNQGKGQLVITNLMTKPLILDQVLIIARAIPFSEKQVQSVNKINEEIKTLTPLEKSDINIGQELDEVVLNRLYDLLQKYRDCFAMNLSEIGCIDSVEMSINLTDDKPVVYRPYRLSLSEREQVREIINDLIDNDIIEESSSNYGSPILLVRKKTGEQRLCVDFRALNRKTTKDCFPIPLIDDQLINLSGNTFFTTLDMASGYYQIPVAKDSQHLTAFVTPDGHYQFKRMPFGLANAPAVFQRVVNNILGAKRFQFAMAYLDDILVPSKDLEQGFQRLEEVLKILRQYGLTLKLSKCRFFDTTINYLGYEISMNGIRPNESKIEAVKRFPTPKNVHEVRQFLGLAGYFRKFVKDFGEIARPLTNLLKKDIVFRWLDQESNSFELLKNKLIERPILSLYNPKLDTELHTDASALGLGGILMQWQENPRVLKPVAYFSRQTTPEERHLHSYELETLAIVASLKKFRVYLLGINFKVVTDCHALRTTLTKRDLIPRIARWWLQISEFTFDIEYRPGSKMAHVDALSRNSNLSVDENNDIAATVYHITTDDWLLTLQMNDPDISRILKILKPENVEEVRDIKQNYVVKNHKLFRKIEDKVYLVVPREARLQICRANHDDMGHLGETKTIEKIRGQFWFPKMRRFIKKYINNCIVCSYNKDKSKNKKSGLLHPIEKINIPFHTIHIDHLGPFVKSRKGNSYILTIVDGFTKYVFVKAVKDTKTKTTIKVLDNIFFDFVLPARIISDRGTSFTSREFSNFCNQYGIKHVLNAVACPRANGQVERFNQTILNSLSKVISGKDERYWDMHLGKIQWSVNNTVNSTTQKTAAETLFGIRSRDSLTNMLDIEESIDYDSLTKIRNEVSENIKTQQLKQKKYYDIDRSPAPVFKVGDLVKITRTQFNNSGNSTKLLSKFIGPYKIIKELGNDRYKISNIPGFNTNKRTFETVVATDRIRPWINTDFIDKQSNLSSSEDSEDDLPLSELQKRMNIKTRN